MSSRSVRLAASSLALALLGGLSACATPPGGTYGMHHGGAAGADAGAGCPMHGGAGGGGMMTMHGQGGGMPMGPAAPAAASASGPAAADPHGH